MSDSLRSGGTYEGNEAVLTAATLHVRLKNVGTLHVNAFCIDTDAYYSEHQCEVPSNLQLDGIEPQMERVLAVDDYRSAFEVKSVAVELDDVFRDGDGVVFVDLIGNGLHSRCIIKRGDLRYIARLSEGGQVLTVLDDACNVVTDAKAAVDGEQFCAKNESGDVYIRFLSERRAAHGARGDFETRRRRL